MTIEQLDKKIEELQKEKQIALLQQDIEKIKKTKIVEETIYIQKYPQYIPCPMTPQKPIYYRENVAY